MTVEAKKEEVTVEPSVEEVVTGKTAEPTGEIEAKKDDTNPDEALDLSSQEKVQEEINKIVAKKGGEVREAQRETQELRDKLEKLEGEQKALPADAPKLEDFDYDEEKHKEALISYRVKKEVAEAMVGVGTQAAETSAKAVREKVKSEYFSEEAKFSTQHKEYAGDIQNLPHFAPDTLDVIYSFKQPVIVQYLGKHLDMADIIANAPLAQAAAKLGQIAERLTKETKTITTTGAPEPVETITGGAGVNKSMDEMSMDEIMALP